MLNASKLLDSEWKSGEKVMKDFHVFFGVARAEALCRGGGRGKDDKRGEGSSLIFISCNLLWLDSNRSAGWLGWREGEGAQQVV